MKTFCPIHWFDVSFEEAGQIQSELRNQVEITDTYTNIDDIVLVGGADVAFTTSNPNPSIKYESNNETVSAESPGNKYLFRGGLKTEVIALAAAVTLDVKRGCIVETAFAAAPVFFPYVPGFLSFREGPAVLRALGKLSVLPEVMIYDGCGIAHPRGLGLASHMSLLTGIPSAGCAKSLLCGTCGEPGAVKGKWTAITYRENVVGTCLRTRDNIRPVFVSPGSGFSIEGAREFVLSLAYKYRLPEPTRLAHSFVTEHKKKFSVTHV